MESRNIKRRELHYVKCNRCRIDKRKCLPINRIWPKECDRCTRMKLQCSEGTRKVRKQRDISNSASQNTTTSLQYNGQRDDISAGPLTNGIVTLASSETRLGSLEHQQNMNKLDHTSDDDKPWNDWILALCFRDMVLAARSVLISPENQLLLALHGDDDVDPLSLCDGSPGFYSKTRLLADLALSMQGPLDSQLSDIIRTGSQDPERIACRIGYIMNELRCSNFDRNLDRDFDNCFPFNSDRFAKLCELLQAVGQCQLKWAKRDFIATWHYLDLSRDFRVGISRVLRDNPYMKTLAIPDEMIVNPIFVPKDAFRGMPGGSQGLGDLFPDNIGRTWLHHCLDDESLFSLYTEDEIVDFINSPEFPGLSDDILGRTPVHIASARGFEEIVIALLKLGENFINSQTYLGQTAFHLAVATGNIGICRRLLSVPKLDIWRRDHEDHTALHTALRQDNVEIYKLIVDHPQSGVTETHRRTHLLFALQTESQEIASYLLDKYERRNARYSDWRLMFCPDERRAQEDIKELFGCRPSSGSYWTPLMYTIWEQSKVSFDLIELSGISVNFCNSEGKTALHFAAENGWEYGVSKLLSRHDLDPNIVDIRGRTPLITAAMKDCRFPEEIYKRRRIVECLLADSRVTPSLSTVLNADNRSSNCNFESEVDVEIFELIRNERERREKPGFPFVIIHSVHPAPVWK